MSSLFKDEVLLGLEIYASIDDPTSCSLLYICAESMLRRVSHVALYTRFATITLDNQPARHVSKHLPQLT